MRSTLVRLLFAAASIGLLALLPSTAGAVQPAPRQMRVAPIHGTPMFFATPHSVLFPPFVVGPANARALNFYSPYFNTVATLSYANSLSAYGYGYPMMTYGYSSPYMMSSYGYGGSNMGGSGYGSSLSAYGGYGASQANSGYQAPTLASSGYQAAAANTQANPIVDVTIYDGSFNPRSITVAPGTTVRFTNRGSHMHTITADTKVWESGPVDPGRVYTFFFAKPGTYAFHCTLHPDKMRGTVVVE